MIENFGVGIDLSNIDRFKKKTFQENTSLNINILNQVKLLDT